MFKLTRKNIPPFFSFFNNSNLANCRALYTSAMLQRYNYILSTRHLFKNLPSVSPYSTIPSPMESMELGPNMKLTLQPRSGPGQKSRKLVLLLEWMMAKDRQMQRYANLYLQEGFDVLSVHVTPLQMLFPTMGCQVVARSVLEYLQQNPNYEDVVVQAFSVGAYLFGEVMVLMKTEEQYSSIPSRIKGIILDSPADIHNIPHGFPRAVASNPMVVKCLEMYTATHMWLMRPVATRHYELASRTFHDTFLTCPSLVLMSNNDLVGGPLSVEHLAKNWTQKGLDLKVKAWEKSQHVSHLHFHESDYKEEIHTFLKKINLRP